MVRGQQLPATVRFRQEEEKGAGRFPGCALTSCCGLGGRATVILWTDDAVVPVPSLFPPHCAHALLWAGQKPLSEGPPGCCGSQVAFKPGNCCPQKPLQLFTPSVCSPPPFQTHPPVPIIAAYFPLGLPSHPPPQPTGWDPAGTGHQADGQLGRGLRSGTTATRRDLLPILGEHWQRHRVEEHGALVPRCLLQRNSGVCQQLQLGITPPAICFLAQEPKSVFRGSRSVHLF